MTQEIRLPTYETLLTEAIRSLAVDSGTVTAPSAVDTNVLQDATKNWAPTIHRNRLVRIIRGAGAGQQAVIENNVTKSLILKQTWVKAIDTTSIYVIINADFMQMLRDVFGGGSDISATNPLQVFDPKVWGAVGLTTYGQRTAPATNANGLSWVDLLDMSILAKHEEIRSVILTVSAGWAGKCRVRIIRSDTGVKIFPFGNYAEQDAVPPADFFISDVEWVFPAPVVVPIDQGYKVQFCSSNAGDGVGRACTLTQLNVIQRG